MVYCGEQSRHAQRPLYAELVRALREAGAAGATALRGIWGYHGDHAPHGDTFWQLRRRVPVVTVIVDTPERIAPLVRDRRRVTDESGLVTSELVPALRATGPGRRGGLRLADPEYAEHVAHEHAHGHAHHHHGPAADADRRWLMVALGIIATFMVVEVVAGVLADSLALLSDAAHMLTDAGAIASPCSRPGWPRGRPRDVHLRPRARRDPLGPGQRRDAACPGRVIAVEAIQRLWSPPDVDGGLSSSSACSARARTSARRWRWARPSDAR